MKAIFLSLVIFLISAGFVSADQYGTIVRIEPHYIEQTVPRYYENCRYIDVPTYRNEASGGDIVTGAIIGGLIGHQFGSGRGNDIMTGLGAIIGAESATKKRFDGYRTVEECETVRQNEIQVIQDGYVVTYRKHNKHYKFITHTYYNIGDRILVR